MFRSVLRSLKLGRNREVMKPNLISVTINPEFQLYSTTDDWNRGSCTTIIDGKTCKQMLVGPNQRAWSTIICRPDQS